jgi:hypothetical protein
MTTELAVARAWASLMGARRDVADARAALTRSPRLRPPRRNSMLADKNGISLSRKELRALLEVAAKEQESRDLYGVHFRVEDKKVFARASNGRIAIQFEGISDGKLQDGEWLVTRKFLVDGKKELEGKQVLSLEFSGKSLHDGVVRENGVALLHVTAESDASVSQASFPAIEKHAKIPSSRREIAPCTAVGAAYLKAVQYAADAVGVEHVDWYPAKDADSPVVFVVGSKKDTSAVGAIMPVPTEGEDGDDDEEESEEKPRTSRRAKVKDKRQTELAS